MNILITGGAGFIGSNLADRLLTKGHNVYIIDNLETGRRDNIPKQAYFTEASIADWTTCLELFNKAKPDIVIHSAASYKDQENWIGDIMTNVIGTANLLKLSKEVKKFIYFQTALCYGHEPDTQPVPLLHHIKPDNSYSISKTAGEQYIEASGIDFVSFRLANVYGPRNISGPVPTFFHRLSNGQEVFISDSRRDFIFIDDLIDIVMLSIEGKGENGMYHISSGKDCSIEEIFNFVAKELGVSQEADSQYGRFKDDTKSILIDPSKTLKDFGMTPSTPLSVGIPKAIKWYKEFGVTETYTHLSAEQLKIKAEENTLSSV